MKYTTVDNVARLLRGRLNIKDSPEVETDLGVQLGYKPSVGSQTIDNNTIEQIAEREESFIELVLGQLYVVPLKLTNPTTRNTLAYISESFIASSLIAIHFEGTSVLQSGDASQTSMHLRREGELRLAQITAGTGIHFSLNNQPSTVKGNVGSEVQPLRLPGETLIDMVNRPDNISRNYSVVLAKNTSEGESFFEDDTKGRCCGHRDGRALGAEKKYF